MFRSLFTKVVVLTPLAFATWFVTSTLLQKNAKGKVAPRPIVTKTAVTLSNEEGQLNGIQRVARGIPAPIFAYCSLKNYKIVAQENAVAVNAEVFIKSLPRPIAHLWRIRITDLNDRAVFDHPYVDQIFPLHPSGEMSPTFADKFPLPPGEYVVRLNLYGVPQDYNLTELNDEEKSRAATMIHVRKQIKID